MVERLLRALPGVSGFLATVVARSLAQLDPSVEGTGPHGLTVRDRAARLAAPSRPSHPAPRFVTTAKRLFGERGMTSLNHYFRISERKIFLRSGLDSTFLHISRCFARRVAAATLRWIRPDYARGRQCQLWRPKPTLRLGSTKSAKGQ